MASPNQIHLWLDAPISSRPDFEVVPRHARLAASLIDAVTVACCIPPRSTPVPCHDARAQNYDLDEIWDDHVYVVLRFWDPATDWVDAAQIMVPVQSIGIRDECDFRTFVLEPVGDGVFDDVRS